MNTITIAHTMRLTAAAAHTMKLMNTRRLDKMNLLLYNILVYICLLFTGGQRLDKTKNDIHDLLMLVGIITLITFALIGCCAVCFWIKPPELYSQALA